jgi:GTP pyrophosphokinase
MEGSIMLEQNEEREVRKIYKSILNDVRKKNGDEEIITKAYEFAYSHLQDSNSKEFLPLLKHALEVGKIVSEQVGLGEVAIVPAMIHNTIYEDSVNYELIEEKFGSQISFILKGYQKISELKPSKEAFKSDNFRKLLLTMAMDVRVILIKLADRLQKMREVDYMTFDAQKEICNEVQHLYIPIAHRLGIYNIKTELEERLMKYTENEIYKDIARKLTDTKSSREKYIKTFIKPIEKEIKKLGVPYEIKGRPKSIFSIWKKMKAQNVGFDEVYDKFAIRIILDSKEDREKKDCWKVYSIVTNIFQPNPKRMRDWISAPKNTGYESLHATVIGPEHKWVEVQIRTTRMDEIAEKGHAAHWMYKEKKTGSTDDWLKKVRETIENPQPDAHKSKDQAKMELYSDTIFIFTPKGDLKKLSYGATILDFAFAVHTKVGSQCTGAKVNGKIVQFKYQLQNGDEVEILTSKNQSPKIDWLNFVNSARSKQKIKRFLKDEEYKEANEGREILIRKFNQAKVKFNDKNLNLIVEHFGLKKPLELYMAIVQDQVDVAQIKPFFTEKLKVHTDPVLETKIKEEVSQKKETNDDSLLVIDNNSNLNDYKLAKCCSPGFGDEIFGFVTVGDGIKIHSKNCPNANQLLTRYPYRIIQAKWGQEKAVKDSLMELRITGNDELGLINQISSIISNDMRVNIKSMSFSSEAGNAIGSFQVYIKDRKHLDVLTAKLNKIKGVEKVKASKILKV